MNPKQKEGRRHRHTTPNRPVILSASDRLVGTPDSSGRWCQIHLAQCPFDHSDSAHHHPNPRPCVIPSETRNPAHAGAPDSSGRRCRIHSAQRGKHATFFHRINPAVRPVETGVPTGL
ncbi:MAG: hypothetical protein WCY21_03090 [Candidatus Cloacimonadaceae bacterium]